MAIVKTSFFRSAAKPSESTQTKDKASTTSSSRSTRWMNRFQSKSQVATSSVTPVMLPCCMKRQAMMANGEPSQDNESTPVVLYKIFDKNVLRKQTAIVGSQRVPFYPMHIATHRVVRSRSAVLDPIDENDMAMCENCHLQRISQSPPCVRILIN
ncbi:hypothetical protein AeMF1_021517 [Aphanomyces euteiches]|nr:hypothetical protein AeMF1_021517 [Aphanomyces euteiches]KAH9197691.1 hypothetical protein AeNC1_000335 [Aphanomyces euteiches]